MFEFSSVFSWQFSKIIQKIGKRNEVGIVFIIVSEIKVRKS